MVSDLRLDNALGTGGEQKIGEREWANRRVARELADGLEAGERKSWADDNRYVGRYVVEVADLAQIAIMAMAMKLNDL